MAKLLFFNIPAIGHVNPTLPVVRVLVERGEDVAYVNGEAMRAKIEATGARFVPYETFPDFAALSDKVAERRLARTALGLVRLSRYVLPGVMAIVEREQPDIIVHDSLTSWGHLAAKKAKLPAVTLVTTLLMGREISRRLPRRAMLGTVAQFVGALPPYALLAARMRSEQGIFPVFLTQAVACYSDLNIVFTSRAFQPGGSGYGEHFRFVGPALSARPDDSAFPFDRLTGQPLVYISLGTIANRQPDFYRACFAALGGQPVQVVLSVGPATDIPALGAIPANFIVRPVVPQLEILRRAAVFVTHGGLNSVHEGLYYGVPLALVPQQVEQTATAYHVADLGAGRVLAPEPGHTLPSPAALRAAVLALLDDARSHEAAAAIGQTLREAGGADRAAEEIVQFASANKS
ncbi:macrolide family glycosyltransferase [Aggregatilinea lenta]|uniref:macrolide family glycosyltransferase n=1 Tax=Aggregatilinea lenta TaxID=913108 RepID=UPI0013C31E7D|nr:macrolide family glycosyltransferase [Aggregatilinea lenta]